MAKISMENYFLHRFYEYFFAEKIFPTMRMEELFAVEAMQSILYRDSSLNTRAMTSYEETPSAVAGLFDGIAYSKGIITRHYYNLVDRKVSCILLLLLFFALAASVIGMFLYSLSETTFHKGLKIYLSKSTSNPEGVAIPLHLYEALQLACDEDEVLPQNYKIKELFGSWENQDGYPIVYVERSYNNHKIRFTQVMCCKIRAVV
jgi:aminopeptidase N